MNLYAKNDLKTLYGYQNTIPEDISFRFNKNFLRILGIC